MTNGATKIRRHPVIRVFISSTFSDLKLERDAIQQRVLPQLEQLCQGEGFQFQAIDLRWGVPTEAGLDHSTMRICFEELHRSQEVSPEPNFLILLGNRYGWRPLPEEINADDYQALEEAAKKTAQADDQLEPIDVLERWYRLDDNALEPTFFLQPRQKPSSDDPEAADFTDPATWRMVEEVLWKIVNEAFPANCLDNRFDKISNDESLTPIVRFQTSATEQEIWHGALSVSDACSHVLAFIREIDQKPDGQDKQAARDFFDFNKLTGEFDRDALTAQQQLISEIKERLGNNAVALKSKASLRFGEDKSGKRFASISDDHIDELCGEVESRLTGIIKKQIEEYWTLQHPEHATGDVATDRSARELEIERLEHQRFAEDYGDKETFVGRLELLQTVHDYLSNQNDFEDQPNYPLVICGPSGSGKTALLARSFQEVPESLNPVIRFIGTRPRASNVRSMLTDLCLELRGLNPRAEPLPLELYKLISEFRQHLIENPSAPVVLFLDALDQLSDADDGRELFWLPSSELPSQVKIVVSCLSDRTADDPVGMPFFAFQKRKLPSGYMQELKSLSVRDAKTLLFNNWLPAAGRAIKNSAQRQIIEERLASKDEDCRQPLFITLLFEEVRRWRSYDQQCQLYDPQLAAENTAEQAVSVAPRNPHIEALLLQLFDRLCLDVNHGDLLVRRAVGYIAAARHGLKETELLGALFKDKQYKQWIDGQSKNNRHVLPTQPPRIPIALWSRLRSDLSPYLTERATAGGNVLTFYHRQIAEWIKERFVDRADWTPLERLAEFFGKQSAILAEDDVRTAVLESLSINVRKVDEEPWLWRQAGSYKPLLQILSDVEFIIAKCLAHAAHDLWEDLSPPDACPADLDWTPLSSLRGQLFHEMSAIIKLPATAPQHLYGGLHSDLYWRNQFLEFAEKFGLLLFKKRLLEKSSSIRSFETAGQRVTAFGTLDCGNSKQLCFCLETENGLSLRAATWSAVEFEERTVTRVDQTLQPEILVPIRETRFVALACPNSGRVELVNVDTSENVPSTRFSSPVVSVVGKGSHGRPSILVATGWDGQLRLLDVPQGECWSLPVNHEDPFQWVLDSSGDSNSVSILAMSGQMGESISRLVRVNWQYGESAAVVSVLASWDPPVSAWSFAAEVGRVAIAVDDRLQIIDCRGEQLISDVALPAKPQRIALSDDASIVVTLNDTGDLLFSRIDKVDWRTVGRAAFLAEGMSIMSVDAHHLRVVVSGRGKLAVYEMQPRPATQARDDESAQLGSNPVGVVSLSDDMLAVAGDQIAVGIQANSAAVVWSKSFASGQRVNSLRVTHGNEILACFSDGTLAAWSSSNGIVRSSASAGTTRLACADFYTGAPPAWLACSYDPSGHDVYLGRVSQSDQPLKIVLSPKNTIRHCAFIGNEDWVALYEIDGSALIAGDGCRLRVFEQTGSGIQERCSRAAKSMTSMLMPPVVTLRDQCWYLDAEGHPCRLSINPSASAVNHSVSQVDGTFRAISAGSQDGSLLLLSENGCVSRLLPTPEGHQLESVLDEPASGVVAVAESVSGELLLRVLESSLELWSIENAESIRRVTAALAGGKFMNISFGVEMKTIFVLEESGETWWITSQQGRS